jgi:hypothetical protein
MKTRTEITVETDIAPFTQLTPLKGDFMKLAQKIKIIPMLLLLWALPMSMLPRVTAKPAPAENKSTPANLLM